MEVALKAAGLAGGCRAEPGCVPELCVGAPVGTAAAGVGHTCTRGGVRAHLDLFPGKPPGSTMPCRPPFPRQVLSHPRPSLRQPPLSALLSLFHTALSERAACRPTSTCTSPRRGSCPSSWALHACSTRSRRPERRVCQQRSFDQGR
eukprot:365204-Chlamydomonas_euryale.AAC.8